MDFKGFFTHEPEMTLILVIRLLSAPSISNPKAAPELHGLDLKFKLKTVHEGKILKIIKLLKPKKSFGHDGITSELLKLGAEVLAAPLIVNFSILTGKYPTNWKIAKIVPLHKKGDKKLLKNYRPIALLSVAGMILERVVALQIEEYFEDLGNLDFAKRKIQYQNC